ncbi:MAG: glycosyltransferase [Bacteroidaceae bacterium]|nr:glycosyltransferase [Bacteroidaceae bacterium]
MEDTAKKIIYIRQAVAGGTDNYCRALQKMFADDPLYQAMPIQDYPIVGSRLFHYYYKPAPLKRAISQADIVHVNGYTAFGTIQALYYAHRQKKKVVYSPHWHPFRHLRHPMMGKLFFQLLLKPFIKRCADTVVTINSEDTQYFRQFHPNVVQIPHWYTPPSPMSTRQPDAQPDGNKPLLLFVGRIDDPVKGIEHLYHLPKDQYDVHCVGKGTLRRSDFTHHPSLTQTELQQLYRQAALTVIPSKYEAFSYVALESMINGTPVVMSDNVRIADYLDGIGGYRIFHYTDYAQFQQAVKEMIGCKVDIEKVEQIFNADTIRQKYLKVYNTKS